MQEPSWRKDSPDCFRRRTLLWSFSTDWPTGGDNLILLILLFIFVIVCFLLLLSLSPQMIVGFLKGARLTFERLVPWTALSSPLDFSFLQHGPILGRVWWSSWDLAFLWALLILTQV